MTNRADRDATETPRWPKRRIALFLVPLFLFYAAPLDFGSNDSLHAFLTVALYERGAIDVEPETVAFFVNQDLTVTADGVYSNKPPGAAVWLLPAALLIDLLTPGKLELQSLVYFGRLLMLGLPFVLFLFALGRALETATRPVVAWGLVLALALGTNASAYASLYFTHVLAAMGLGVAFLLLWFEQRRLYWLAGLACAFAVTCELTTASVAAVLAVAVPFRRAGRPDWRRALPFWLAAVPVAVALFLYNRSAFGGALTVGHQVEFEHLAMASSFYGFDGPDLGRALALTFRPAVGLLFHSPWLLLAIPGILVAMRTPSLHRRMTVVSAIAFAALFLTICSHRYWIGGAVAGPRYLTAGLPFLLFPIATLFTTKHRPLAAWTLGILPTAGALWNTVIVASTPFVPVEAAFLDDNAVASLCWPLLRDGVARFSAAHLLGANDTTSMLVFAGLFTLIAAGYLVSGIRSKSAAQFSVVVGLVGVAAFVAMTRMGTTATARHASTLDAMKRDAPHRVTRFRERRRATAVPPETFAAEVKRLHAGLDAFIANRPEVTVCARGLGVPVAPVWRAGDGLYFSDVYKNVVFRYTETDGLRVHRYRSGYDGTDVAHHLSAGSSALAFDEDGGLLIAEQGNRRLTRVGRDGRVTTIADRFEGERLNGPDAIAIARDGAIYFADTTVGLRHGPDDPSRGVRSNAIYRVKDGHLARVATDWFPNGLAFSPDGRWLYVTNYHPKTKLVVRYAVAPDGSLRAPRPFADFGNAPFPDPVWNISVGRSGTLYVPGPGGVWLVSPAGDPLGVIRIDGATGAAWGGADGRTLFVTAPGALYTVRMRTADGAR